MRLEIFELLDMRKRAVPLFKERHYTMIIQNGKFEKPVWQGEIWGEPE